MRARLQFLGTGNAVCLSGRGQAACWFEDDAGALLVDCGPSFLLNANRFGADLTRLRAVAITHFHGDHLAGLPFLLVHFRDIAHRTEPLHVLGPRGLPGRLRALCETLYDHWELGFELVFHEWDPAGPLAPWEGFGWRLAPAPMRHKPESLGYRLITPQATVAFTGDTALFDGVFRLADGADVLVVECSLPGPLVPVHIHARELVDALPQIHARRIAAVHTENATREAASPLPDRLFFPHDGDLWEL